MVDAVIEFLKQNDLASGGIVVVLFGSLSYFLRQVPARIFSAIHRRVVLSIEVLDNDESFSWISRWLAEHEYASRSRRMSVLSRPCGDSNSPVVPQSGGASPEARDSTNRQIRYVPSPGWHVLRAFGAWFVVVRMRGEPQVTTKGFSRLESFVFYTMVWNRAKAAKVMQAAHDLLHPPGENKVSIYSGTYSWLYLSYVPARPIETVMLPNGIEREVLTDVQDFLAKRDWDSLRRQKKKLCHSCFKVKQLRDFTSKGGSVIGWCHTCFTSESGAMKCGVNWWRYELREELADLCSR